MKKILLAENFYQYQFPPQPEQHFGFNIFVLIASREALFIDTGFQEHASAVKDDLCATGIEPRKVIISHFHEDHIEGLRVLPNLPVFGSKAYQASLDRSIRKENHKYFQPTNVVAKHSSLRFGDFRIRLIATSGHSVCGLYTIVNDRFVHVGDDILCSNEGVPLLPSVSFVRISAHITALEKLCEYKSHVLLLGHGNPISGEANVLEAIDNRLKYLRTVAQYRSRISYEAATKECTCNFLHSEWHEYFYQ